MKNGFDEGEVPLPSFEEIQFEIPLKKELESVVKDQRLMLNSLVSGQDGRFLMMSGPCSNWTREAFLEYAQRAAQVQEIPVVRENIVMALRNYGQKPRTITDIDQWQGTVYQPDPFKPVNLAEGIRYHRSLSIDALEYELPLVDEMLFLENGPYFEGIFSYLAVGARTSEAGAYRSAASNLRFPAGMKNTSSGRMKTAINNVLSAQRPNIMIDNFPYRRQIMTKGNPFAHLILRGSDEKGPNYFTKDLKEAAQMMKEAGVRSPAIVVDSSHDQVLDPATGKKDPLKQSNVILDVLKSMEENPDLPVVGTMSEVFLKGGNCKLPPKAHTISDQAKLDQMKQFSPGGESYGKSITDPCLPADDFFPLVEEVAKKISHIRKKRNA